MPGNGRSSPVPVPIVCSSNLGPVGDWEDGSCTIELEQSMASCMAFQDLTNPPVNVISPLGIDEYRGIPDSLVAMNDRHMW